MNTNQPSYFPHLDALRAIAALFVIFEHLSYWFLYPPTPFYDALKTVFSFGGNGGRLGVIFFFVLSGFLITYLLLRDEASNGRINVGHFYMRRILRIWPLYFLIVILALLVLAFSG